MSSASLNTQNYRLPDAVKPAHYDLTIRTDLKDLSFDGVVLVDLDVKKETKTVVFNTADLELSGASIHSDALQKEQVQSSVSFDTASERAAVEFATALPAQSKARLRIGFKGKLTGSMLGYYKAVWKYQGETKNYALTQFEPTAARRAFPCWDEPLLKATYSITLISRADTVNLSNMPASSEEIYEPGSKQIQGGVPELAKLFSALTTGDQAADKWKITRFEETPPVSTYLVAWANGYFEYLESSYKSPLSGKTRPLRIYATPDHIHQAQFALNVKQRALPLYEQVFDVEYPLPKLDTLVASDFDAGAMENWGLITGRTNAFLLDLKNADIPSKKWVASVQSHEVAHMWFGNITTMSWWDNLYLNEGFATLMGEVIILDKIFPEWRADTEFITNHLARALAMDAKLSSHPVEVECPDANQINQIFDDLSYSKAASVLRMLSRYVGEEKFLKGVSIYLKRHLYGNSVTKDLWDGISEAAGLDVAKMMDHWISKMGYPVLTVTESENQITVRQDRFLETGLAAPEENTTIWIVPLAIASVENGKPVVNSAAVLKDREATIHLDTSKPFKLNAGTTGFYRVLYTPERLGKISLEASKGSSSFSSNDRIGLVHDTMALAKAGLYPMSAALDLIYRLGKPDEEYLVWDSMMENISSLRSIWYENERILYVFNLFIEELLKPLVQKLGYDYPEGERTDTALLRTQAIEGAAAARHAVVVNELRSRFAHFMETNDESKIPANLQRITYATAVKYGTGVEYAWVKQIYKQPKTPQAGIAAMLAMCANEDPKLNEETFDYALNEARDQDLMYFFRGFQRNYKARRLLVDLFKTNYDVLHKRYENNFVQLGNLVKTTLSCLSSAKDYNEMQEFFKDKDTSKYQLALSQSLDGIQARSAIIQRSTDDVLGWLLDWSKEDTFEGLVKKVEEGRL